MNLKTTLLAATLAAFAASTAYANEEHHPDGKAEAVKEKKAEAKKPVKKHSHAEEKSNMPMPEPASGVGEQDTMMKTDKHDHTKDRH
ncbi:MAG: hypothetical protein HZB95_02945 [Nitrosomonadales bacterium]|nr:hypothetical protein [Nitrosomonadales bacterium]